MTALGVGIVGMGFMGRQHLASYLAAAADGVDLRVAALCDPDPSRCVPAADAPPADDVAAAAARAPDVDLAPPRSYREPAALFADPDVALVSVCTYTDSHVRLALQALEAGKHVVVEKPVALDAAPIERLAAAARAHPAQLCMPAMCVRFWPGWDELAAAVADGRHGAVLAARFRRSGPRPDWADSFYADPARCGGALVDLHIHDADFVRACFGAPAAVECTGTLDAPRTRYVFDAAADTSAPSADRAARRPPPEVLAEAAWLDDAGAAFSMGFEVEFERATLRYRFGDAPSPLAERAAGADAFVARAVSALSGYDAELRHAVACVQALARDPGAVDSAALLDEAADLARLLVLEAESLDAGGARRALR